MGFETNFRYGYRKQLPPRPLPPMARVNVNEWISYKEFRALPKTLQRVYAQTIVDRYKVGAIAFAAVWGKSVPWISRMLLALGVTMPKRMNKADKERFLEFVQSKRSGKRDNG